MKRWLYSRVMRLNDLTNGRLAGAIEGTPMGFDPAIERDKIEAGDDLSSVEIGAARQHLRDLLAQKGRLSGCTSYTQRKMQIGYNHAARIMEYLEACRIITEPDNAGVRHPGPSWADL